MKIFIGVPCYDEKVISDCMLSIIRNKEVLEKAGHSVVVQDMKGCCYLPTTRNVLVKRFLDTDCDELILVDNDLGFDDDAMLKLVNTGEDVCLGAYPYRNASLGFPIKIVDDPAYESPTPLVKMVNDVPLVEITLGPTGLMKISRGVFEAMIAAHPEWKHNTVHGDLHSVFDTGHLLDDGNWYGEDVMFCHRWREMGGHIYCLPDITFRHHGIMNANGNFHNYLMQNKKACNPEGGTLIEKLDNVLKSVNENFEKLKGVRV